MNKREQQQYREARIHELQTTIDTSYDEINELRAKEYSERNASKVGKCYRYEYHYSDKECQQSYIQITGIDKNGSLMAWRFERDLDNEIYISLHKIYRCLGDNYDSYKEISPDDFQAEWNLLQSELDKLTKL